ncbi:hypothetical protein C0L86_14340 [Streptomyces sp. SCA2-2]|nr:hypothetical protein C0L86_14340 [Streptomyces sp. SCA2-2]
MVGPPARPYRLIRRDSRASSRRFGGLAKRRDAVRTGVRAGAATGAGSDLGASWTFTAFSLLGIDGG